MLATKTAISLHWGQWAILRSRARTTVATAGQGGGKTTAGYYWLLANMRAWSGESHLIGFPDYGLLQRVIINQPDPDRQTIVQFLAFMGEAPKTHILERRIECRSGQVFFASGEDLVGWEGAHVKTAWLDEFDEMPLQAYRRAMERTRMRHGFVLLTGTPRNVRWIGEELKPLWERGDPTVCRVQFPSTANPKYAPEAIAEAKRLLPNWEFQRLYMGELATMEGGGVFRREWWQYYTSTPERCDEIIQVWDTAFKEKAQNDYSVCATWGRIATRVLLLDLWRAKVEFPDLVKTAISLYNKHRPGRVLIEDAASGQSLIQELRRETHLPILPVKVDRDKYSRASAVTGMVESGRVYLPSSAPWLHDYIEELAAFQNIEWHDDQVDVTSMGLGYFAARGGRRIGLYMPSETQEVGA